MSKLPSRTYGGTPARMPTPPQGAPSHPPTPPGGAVPRVTRPQPTGRDNGRPVTIPRVAAVPSAGSHISEAVRGALGGLDPEIAAGVRVVAAGGQPVKRDPR